MCICGGTQMCLDQTRSSQFASCPEILMAFQEFCMYHRFIEGRPRTPRNDCERGSSKVGKKVTAGGAFVTEPTHPCPLRTQVPGSFPGQTPHLGACRFEAFPPSSACSSDMGRGAGPAFGASSFLGPGLWAWTRKVPHGCPSEAMRKPLRIQSRRPHPRTS